MSKNRSDNAETNDLLRRIEARAPSKRMSRAQLAVACGVDIATIHRWRRGVTHPSPLALDRLRRIAGLVKSDKPF